MTHLKKYWDRFVSYQWGAKLFILLSPTFRWDDITYILLAPDTHTVVRYFLDVFICLALVELITQIKEK